MDDERERLYGRFWDWLIEWQRATGVSQRELARRLTEAGSVVGNSAVSLWFNRATVPEAHRVPALSRVTGVPEDLLAEMLHYRSPQPDDLPQDEKQLLYTYRKLWPIHRHILQDMAAGLKLIEDHKQDE